MNTLELFSIFKHAVMISFFVFVMMLIVDFADTASKRRISHLMKGGRWRQYSLASFLGSTPGCLGAFMNVSLYVHGMISFGAIVGGMIATSGDEAFVMLAQFPLTAIALFSLLFVLGVFFAWISDRLIDFLKITPCEACHETSCDHCESEHDSITRIRDILLPDNFIHNFRELSFTRFLLMIKAFNLVFGLCVGVALFALGL